MIDYEILRLMWWALLGVLLAGFAIMDGFDLGIAMLFRFIGRNDAERRVLLETIEPVWDGNQVWLLLGGGAIFAAWPLLYAAAFSGFYEALLLVLLALILRPVSFVFRGKLVNQAWRNTWDWGLCVSGLVPSLVFGVAFGNVLQGVPFSFDDTLRMTYEGSFFALLNPFAVLCGLVSVVMLAMHGMTYAAIKTESAVQQRVITLSRMMAVLFVLLFAAAGLWVAKGVDGYHVTSVISSGGASNPLNKQAAIVTGAWLENYNRYPWMLAAPILAFAGAAATLLLVRARPALAFVSSSIVCAATICTVGFSLFPFLLPSSSHPQSSLTVWDASSSQATLFNMLIAVIIFVPLVLLYTSWVFRVLRGKVSIKDLHDGAY